MINTKTYKYYRDKWLSKRIPTAKSVQLSNRSIFILPSKMGIGFLVLCFILFLTGTNYQNNLILLICYISVSLFISAMIFAYFNLKDLVLSQHKQERFYAGSNSFIHIKLGQDNQQTSKNAFSLHFKIENQPSVSLDKLTDPCVVQIPTAHLPRGKHKQPRIKVYSNFPCNLFTCWSYVDLDIHLIIYPSPKNAVEALNTRSSLPTNESKHSLHGKTDFESIRDYQKGDSPNIISWKHVAKYNDRWVSKTFEQQVSVKHWLDYNAMSGDKEARLSQLCYLVTQQGNVEFGLKLPKQIIEQNKGQQHTQNCLEALALC
ncbi:DUF58 domain-containing protein [Flocculibacter collagenilyticus]|uniref:DUF58 domain-containing protein n=1 Tax=Flocculibacter collagenilyticus TaxID=2744479 RepID=UPI0018F705E2|nr:DUF58 domain-containing protein [Flocculibacter collagenilyticus]